jgi:hypothetical protein
MFMWMLHEYLKYNSGKWDLINVYVNVTLWAFEFKVMNVYVNSVTWAYIWNEEVGFDKCLCKCYNGSIRI